MSRNRKSAWIAEQNRLKQQLIVTDTFSWKVPEKFGYAAIPSPVDASQAPPQASEPQKVQEQAPPKAQQVQEQQQEQQAPQASAQQQVGGDFLRLVGGMDISFIKEDPNLACAALVVMDISTMQVVYEDLQLVPLTLEYIPGFLAFRESPLLLQLLEKLRNSPTDSNKFPQLIMIDGNGILHPRGFGLASHLGVLADVPTLGIGKTLFEVDGLNEYRIRRKSKRELKQAGESFDLIGRSGRVWGAALRSTLECFNPVYVSIGHKISLETGLDIVRKCCQFRIPEPVRQADKRSREYLRVNGYTES